MEDLNTFCYIEEQTSYKDDYKDFGYKVHDRGNRFFVTFEAVLQSFGVMNRNHRMYEASNIMNCINNDEYVQTMLATNSWFGEADHPEPAVSGEELTINRIAKADMTKTSHRISKPRLDGNLLLGDIQTDSGTAAGMNMAIKIVDSHMIPCFSARVLGSLNNRAGKPVVTVKKLITYDWVQYPSHREAMAKIKPVHESVDEAAAYANARVIRWPELAKMATENDEAANFVCESFGLEQKDLYGVTDTGNSVVLTENNNVYIQPISDKFVRHKTQNILKDWLNK